MILQTLHSYSEEFNARSQRGACETGMGNLPFPGTDRAGVKHC